MKRSRLLLAAAATTVLAGLIGTAAAAAGAATPAPEIVTYGYKDSVSERLAIGLHPFADASAFAVVVWSR